MIPAGLIKEYSNMLAWILRLLDMSVVFLTGVFAYWLKFKNVEYEPHYLQLVCTGCLLTPIVFQFFQIYSSIRINHYQKHFFQLLQAFLGLILLLISFVFITKTSEHFSRMWFVEWIFLGGVFLLVLRGSMISILRYMRKKGLNERKVVICGDEASYQNIYEGLRNSLWTGFKIVARVSHAIEENLIRSIEESNAEEVWLTSSLDENGIKKILHVLRFKTVTTRLFLNLPNVALLNSSVEQIAGFPVINLRTTPMTGINRILKGFEDRILAFIILVLISPLFLFIAIAIRCNSKGPIFFRQKRVSWNGKEFEMLKFRSMPIDAEEKTGPVWAKKDEKRATSVGRILRKTSIDEIPQFINVLKGDMSIVGPRPERLVFVEEFKEHIPNYMQKHLVKAGITGWAQVNGWRGNTSLEKRIEYDLYYIENWSLYFDLKIIVLTVFQGFLNKNAY